jgi:HPt (histidine-containing phosphotransfer) domain-containing protein
MATGGTAMKAELHSDHPKRASRPVDLVHLAKQCLGDEFLELEVLRLFDTTLNSYCSRLVLSEDAEQTKLLLHSIKGASVGVGAWAIADLAKSMEADLREGRVLTQERIDDLAIMVGEVRTFIDRLVANSDE